MSKRFYRIASLSMKVEALRRWKANREIYCYSFRASIKHSEFNSWTGSFVEVRKCRMTSVRLRTANLFSENLIVESDNAFFLRPVPVGFRSDSQTTRPTLTSVATDATASRGTVSEQLHVCFVKHPKGFFLQCVFITERMVTETLCAIYQSRQIPASALVGLPTGNSRDTLNQS